MTDRAIEDIYPLSPLQQGMLFHDLYAPESRDYLVQICWTVKGPLDPAAFQRAWDRAVARHPILRTDFAWEDVDEPLQVVYREMSLPVEYRDWSGLSAGEREARLSAFLDNDRSRGFDLSQVPLMRVSLIRTGEREFRFVWTLHHILLDGWSLVRVLREVLACCEADFSGREADLSPSRPYRDYIAWLKRQDVQKLREFWQKELAGFHAPTALAIGSPYGRWDGDPYREERLSLPAGISAALTRFARRNRMTLNTVFQGVWAILLSRYSGDEDVVFGTTVSGRPPELEGMESMVGLFINTLPLRARVDPERPLLDWLRDLQLRQVDARQFEHSPLWEIQGLSEVPRGTSLFESLLVFENFPLGSSNGGPAGGAPQLSLSDIRYWTHTSYPLHLRVRPNQQIAIDLNYDARRFDGETVHAVMSHLTRVLEAAVTDPGQKLKELPRLHDEVATGARRRRTVRSHHDTGFIEFPREVLESSIPERFARVAAERPDALALVSESHRLTYSELAREAGRIAASLGAVGGAGGRVALLFEHGVPMISAILGVLQAGKTYVPLDPAHPVERLEAIMEDSGARAIVTAGRCREQARRLAATAAKAEPVLVYDLDGPGLGEPTARPNVSPETLAYILYTSGSTGRPKGTMQSHRNVLYHVLTYTNALRIGPGDRLTLLSSYGFDASVMAIFGAILNGATLHPFSIAQQGIAPLGRWMEDNAITLYHSTPSVFRYLIQTLASGRRHFSSLRAIVLGGEEVTRRDVGLYREHFTPDTVLVNGLGPTESTLALQNFIDGETQLTGERVPVGLPVEGTDALLLNERGEPTELYGELAIRSSYVALGYWNQPELTSRAFLPDPDGSGRRIYRSGDLARRLPGGEFVFVGRKDFQIKIRGMRVETSAVESFLVTHPGVKDSIVTGYVPASGEDQLLVAYIVAAEGESPGTRELRSFLLERLPSHMVPTSFVTLDALPLTATGKVDRRRLPEPPRARAAAPAAFVEPRTPTEEMLCSIWSDVLGVERVSVNDDFFELGGHSLRATQVSSRIREAFDVALPLRSLFETTILSELAARIDQAASGAGSREIEAIPLLPRDRDLALSFSQERLWFFDQMEPESATYNIAAALQLRGELDKEALERSLAEIVRRHETLRSGFRSVGGVPVVHVAPEDSFVLNVVPLTDEAASVADWLRAEAARPFDLSQGCLLRCTVVRLSERDHVVAVVTHHIVCDGWSLGIFLRELGALYEAFVKGEAPALPHLPVQYADFASWQRSVVQGDVLEAQIAYWKQEIGGVIPTLELPTDSPRPRVQTYRGAREPIRLSRELTGALKRLCREEDVTLFMTLLASVSVLLSRYSGSDDILIGSPIAGRSRVEAEPLIGCFVNTLAFRTDLGGDPSFRELLGRVRRKALDAYANQDLPFEKLVEELQPERDLGRNPLFQVVFALQNAPLSKLELPGLETSGVEVPSHRAHFDWTFTLLESGGEIRGALEYNTDLFRPATIRRALEHFERLLQGVVVDAEQRVSAIPLLSDDEIRTLEGASGSLEPSATGTTILELFDREVLLGGDRVAVVSGDVTQSYAELDALANGIARELSRRGVGSDEVVGTLLPRGSLVLASLLGVLKSGGAYLALDGSYPIERLRYLMDDSAARFVLTERAYWEGHPSLHRGGWEPVFVETLTPHDSAPPVHPDAASLAYVTYTSGSTGKPKGVEVSHRGVVRLVKGVDYVTLDSSCRLLQLAPVTFDASTFEIWGALLNGGRVVLYPERVPSAEELRDELRRHDVTTLWLTGALFNALVDESPDALKSVREVIAGGEALSVAHVRRAQQACPETTFVNGYGPTEGTTFTCCHRIPALGDADADSNTNTRSIPIGRPLPETAVYVLDAHLNPVPLGVTGELYIGGNGVARGYRARPELTAERFVPDPYSRNAGSRMYRTGDLVRRLSGGALDYLGRVDEQVKLRGYRVEPGEVESFLESHPRVQDSAVVISEDAATERRLVGYVVLAPKGSVTDTDLRDYLSERLPEYMIPQAIIELSELPLTVHGKLDREALPKPEWGGVEGASGVEPRSAVEESLVEIFSELLGVEHVSIRDSFFGLGGHSLLAAQLVSRVRKSFRVDLPLRDFFLAPTIADLARKIEGSGDGDRAAAPLVRIPRDGELPLSFSQQRLWFMFQLEPDNTVYNIASGVRLTGPLDVEALDRSLTSIVSRHESLRTSFPNFEGRPRVMLHAPDDVLRLSRIDLGDVTPSERRSRVRDIASAESARPFELGSGPLFRALAVRLSDSEHVLLLTMHHIVSDGWSMKVLFRELSMIYRAAVTGTSANLPELPVDYVDYAHWQRRYLSGARLERELDYWKRKLDGVSQLELPVDRARPPVQTHRGARRHSVLGPDLTAALRDLARQAGVTTFMLFLAIFQAFLRRYTGQDDIVVGTPTANRNREEIEGAIGFFVNNLVLRCDLSGDPTFRELLERVRDVALDAYAHQQLPFEKLVEELAPDRDMSRNPLFQVSYVHEVGTKGSMMFHDVTLSPLSFDVERAHFDLSLFTYESEHSLTALFEYNVDLFEASTVDRLLRHLHRLAECVAGDPDAPLSLLGVLSQAEERMLLSEWAAAPSTIDVELTVHQKVSEMAGRDPSRAALDFPDARLTYGELECRANRLANHLRRLGVGLETRVGVLLDRSADTVVSLLAVMKSGGCYVPLDPSYPDERLAFLARDAELAVVVSDERHRGRVPPTDARLVLVDAHRPSLDHEPATEPPELASPDSLAYVMYTSGSTGQPKGVAVSHRAVTRLVVTPNFIRITPSDRVSQVSNISFDAATFEIWGALCNGAVLAGIERDVTLTPEGLGRELRARGVSVLFLTTALYNMMVREAGAPLSTVATVLFGGEMADVDSVRACLASGGSSRLVHVYGPTESTTFASYHDVTEVAEDATTVPIGGPLSATELLVLDADLNPAPVGVTGELYIGGDGLARGYVGRPTLTAERFVPHPFSGTPGARLYRTGDRVRWRSRGRLDFLGRHDDQVKIRGFRVELDEIVAVLAGHDNVAETLVTLREDEPGRKRLVAYVVAKRQPAPSVLSLRAHLEGRLPDYMVPHAYVMIPAFPLTPNGKTDRARLPAPERLRPALAAGFEAPRNPLERDVATLWMELLSLDSVGVHDNFFDLGGHSLLLAELHGQLKKRFAIDVPMVKLFQFPTIASFSEHLDEAAPERARRSFKTVRDRVERQKKAFAARVANERSRRET